MIRIDSLKYLELEKLHLDFFKKTILEKIEAKINSLPRKSGKNYHLYCFLKKNVSSILIGNPAALKKLTLKYELFGVTKVQNQSIERIFSYKSFARQSRKPWNAYKLCEKLDVRVCPYCNRNFTFTVTNGIKNITRPTLDHFYDQMRYPFLALSLYNLIPSCYTCNSTLKGTVPVDVSTHLHPVMSGFENEFKFRFLKEEDVLDGIKTDQLGAYIKSNLKLEKQSALDYDYFTQSQGNISLFKLNEIYASHYPEMIMLYEASKLYNKSILKGINGIENLFKSKEELYIQLFQSHLDPKDFGKTVLSKLKRDIAEETGLLENLRKFFAEE